jgi:hypothetical protein
MITVMASAGTVSTLALGAEESPAVTPYRPSVSTPAALSAPGWLELEAGVQADRGNASSRRDSLPFTLKLAFTPDWGVRLGGEAWVRQTDDAGGRISGIGDSSIVLKRRFAVNDTSAFGVEAGVKFPTGRDGISSGKSDTSINGIYSADLGSYHTDINLVATRLDAIDRNSGRMQTLWAASLSRPLNDQWGLVGELSGTHQRAVDSTTQFLFAASYNVSKALSLDAGVGRRWTSGAPGWSFFSGLTALTGRVF